MRGREEPTETAGPTTRAAGTVPLAAAVASAILVLAHWLARPGLLADLALFAAGTTGAVALLLPWVRRRTGTAIARATDAADQARNTAMAVASGHHARTQAIVETATEGIVTIDAAGRIETINGAAEKLFGYTAAEAIGQNVRILMPQPHRDAHDGYLARYLSTGEKHIIGIGREVIGLHKDGTLFPMELSVGEGWSAGQRFFTALIRDVTERKEMQTKLSQTERLAAVGELAAGVAHEVNNPINTIINCAQLIRDGDDPQQNGQIIIEEGERIAEIVRDLLQFARDDRDRPQPTSLNEVVQRTLRLIGENFKRHGVALDLAIPDELPAVMARPQQIQQVLLNLLINAKDALVHGGQDRREVTVTAAIEGNGACLIVKDNGPGIPEHLGTRIFEPFVTTKRARGGTGLGLSISKSIVEGYGGTITVESRPGEGATFRTWLPFADRAE